MAALVIGAALAASLTGCSKVAVEFTISPDGKVAGGQYAVAGEIDLSALLPDGAGDRAEPAAGAVTGSSAPGSAGDAASNWWAEHRTVLLVAAGVFVLVAAAAVTVFRVLSKRRKRAARHARRRTGSTRRSPQSRRPSPRNGRSRRT
jgi:hypothetical protein